MLFDYKAFDGVGRKSDGNIDAIDSGDAMNKLRAQGLMPVSVSAAGAERSKQSWLTRDLGDLWGRGMGLEQRAKIARLLATLLGAGIPLDRALKLLEVQAPSARVKGMAEAASEAVVAGKPLSEALQTAQLGFAADEIGLIKAGEQTGTLGAVLEDLSFMLERRNELRSRMISALVYPAILLVMALLSLVVIATVLIPNIAPLFANSSQPMPIMVTVMMAMTDAFSNHGLKIALLSVAFLLLTFIVARQLSVKRWLERVSLRLPFVGIILRLAEQARLCRTLGTLLRSGVAMQTAMAATCAAVRRESTRIELADVAERVTSGAKLGEAIAGVSVVTPATRQMIGIGEQTNRLDHMLLHAATGSESEAAARIERLMTLLTPLMTIGLGLLIGGLIMSVMRAILSVNELVVQ
jgi:general secretion pathway protein F